MGPGADRPATPPAILAAIASAGVAVDLRQWAAIADAVALIPSEHRTPELLAEVMSAILARSARQQATLRDLLRKELARERQSGPDRKEVDKNEWTDLKAPDFTAGIQALTVRLQANVDRAADQVLELFLPPEQEPGGPRRLGRIVRTGLILALATGLLALLAWLLWQVDWACTDCNGRKRGPQDNWGLLELAMVTLATLLVALVIRGIHRRLPQRRQPPPPVPEPPHASGEVPPGPARFRTEVVGGTALRQLDRRAGLAAARAVPYRAAEAPGPRLDAPRSARRTAGAGGVPRLAYHPRREVWPVIVLVDEASAARSWSDLPEEVAAALGAAGVEVTRGRFAGKLDLFELEDGARLDAARLLRRDGLVLVFSDGAGLRDATLRGSERGEAGSLRRLSASGRVAWIEERETRFWDQALDLHIGRPDLPVWLATPEGIESALRQLGGERLVAPRPLRRSVQGRPLGLAPTAHLAEVLGEALGWAAACAMVQPIGPPLAERLRAEFFPHVPRMAFGRLARLAAPGMTRAGLRFEHGALAELRAAFSIMLDPSRQEEILLRIEALIESHPVQPGSGAELAKRWHLTRVRLERDPDGAVPELEALGHSPLGAAIRRELSDARLPGVARLAAGEGTSVMPLRRTPRDLFGFLRATERLGLQLGGPPVVGFRLLPFPSGERIPVPSLPLVAAISETPRRVAMVTAERELRIWNVQREREEGAAGLPPAAETSPEYPGELRQGAVLAANGSLLAVFGNRLEGIGRGLWLLEIGESGLRLLDTARAAEDGARRLLGPIHSAAISPDGRHVVAASGYEGLVLVDRAMPDGGLIAREIAMGRSMDAVAFSEDGVQLLVSQGGNVMRVPDWREAVAPGPPLSSSAWLDGSSWLSHAAFPFRIEALAVGPGGWPVVAAGEGQIGLHLGERLLGPWPLPLAKGVPVTRIELTEERVAAVQAGHRLAILHLGTGRPLLDVPEELSAGDGPVVVGASLAHRHVLLWEEGTGLAQHGLERAGGAEGGEAPAEAVAA